MSMYEIVIGAQIEATEDLKHLYCTVSNHSCENCVAYIRGSECNDPWCTFSKLISEIRLKEKYS